MEISKEPYNSGLGFSQSIEYYCGFDINELKPRIGNIFSVFIREDLLLRRNLPIANRNINGCVFYDPSSDLAAIAIHCGCLFSHPEKSSVFRRKWCTIRNFYEVMFYPDAEYMKQAILYEFPQNITILGLNVQYFIDNSPKSFISSNRNGLKTRSNNQSALYSIRIHSFRIITEFDQKPILVSPSDYMCLSIPMPVFKLGSDNDLGMSYNAAIFTQIFSPYNCFYGFFIIYRLFFECDLQLFEIFTEDSINFSIVHIKNISIRDLKVKSRAKYSSEVLESGLKLHEFVIKHTGIKIRDKLYDPISTVYVSMFYGKPCYIR